MHPRIQEALDYLDTTRSELSEAVEGTPATRREERPATDRWSVVEVLDHLNITEGRVVQMFAGRIAAARAAGLRPEMETSSILDSVNRARIIDRSQRVEAPEMIRPQTTSDVSSVQLALQQSRASLREAILTGDGLALGEVTQQHPVLGPLNLYQWMIVAGAHEARHTAQIREIAREFAGHGNKAASAE